MIKERTIKVYNIDDLEETAQENAYNQWLQNDNYFWHDENVKTLQEFENIFSVKVTNFEYGYRNYINFKLLVDDDIAELKGIRLLKYLVNNFHNVLFKGKYYSVKSGKFVKHKRVVSKTLSNGIIHNAYRSAIEKEASCVLTGYCVDDDILKPIYKFLKRPEKETTLYDLINDCLQSWIYACNQDYESSQSFEAFKEASQINEWEYNENGDLL